MTKLAGTILISTGIYFLGQNIILATTYYFSIPALCSVLSIITGIIALVFFSRDTGNLGWILISIGILLVFFSGRIILRPTIPFSFIGATFEVLKLFAGKGFVIQNLKSKIQNGTVYGISWFLLLLWLLVIN